MDKLLSVLIVEDDPKDCALFVQYVETAEDVELVGVTNNTVRALALVEEYLPDAIILDLELHKGSGNGISFLSTLRETQITPYILVTTNNISSITHEQARQLGADFILVKSQADYSAEMVIEFLRSMKGIIHNLRKQNLCKPEISPSEIKNKIFKIVASEIDRIGISPKVKGRNYLIDAILLLVENKEKNVISIISQKYNKTNDSVERAMQNAIDRAWKCTSVDDLLKHYTAYIRPEKNSPTLTEFIYHYANKIKTKY